MLQKSKKPKNGTAAHTHTHTHVLLKARGKRAGFTLAEVLITLGIIGVIAALSLPPLIESSQESQMVTGLLKFASTMQQAIDSWKQDIGCYSDAYTCLAAQGLSDNVDSNFNQISKSLNIIKSLPRGSTSSVYWLPAKTSTYYGNIQTGQYEGVSSYSNGAARYLLKDGTTFSVDSDPAGFTIFVDVNGPKPPNRIGKDTFIFTLGNIQGKDLLPFSYWGATGICNYGSCNPDNTDPTVSHGASPTSYVILHHKLPDFGALSKTVSGFKP